jgi:DNA-binding transcriptional MerR regulator/methylmalonyl-CoA mutase cobalamin-binding subunit
MVLAGSWEALHNEKALKSMTLSMTNTHHTIADVERDTGLSKDTLRVWERRYGFPDPLRDAVGERRYDDAQLLRLRHLRRLLDAGFRAGQIVPLPLPDLLALPVAHGDAPLAQVAPVRRARREASKPSQRPPHIDDWMALLRQHDARALRRVMEQHLLAHGLGRLVRDGIAPMNVSVGQSWLAGQLAIFEEHLYAEVVQQVLRQALSQLATGRTSQPPRVLLTTVPGEPHGLGLLMAECEMALAGCDTLALGVQTPLAEIVAAAGACKADVVALGFSAVLNPRDVRAALTQLRAQLPADRALWSGGHCPALSTGTSGRGGLRLVGHRHLPSLDDIALAVAHWRASAEQPAAPAASAP